jgi:crotonobetainyl-CoA:carnitine CoA-transferase CaiB-like acyl-CoA transferase
MTDPRSDLASGDVVAQAESGITSYLGEEDGSPLCNPGSPADVAAAVQVAFGITAALAGRLMGETNGVMLDVSILDAYIATDLTMLPMVAATNGAFKARRSGPLHPTVFPHGVFKAGKEFVTISAYGSGPHGHWPRLARAMGHEKLASDPQLSTDEQRSHRRGELTTIVEDWLGSFASAQQGVDILRKAGVVAARVLNAEELITDERARSRGIVQSVEHPISGRYSVMGLPMMINGHFAEARPAPAKGQDTRDVLRSSLGLSTEQIDDLVLRKIAMAA